MSRNTVRKGFNDPFFDGMGAEMRGMQKELFKAVPWWMRVVWAVCALLGLAIGVGVIALLVVLIRHFS